MVHYLFQTRHSSDRASSDLTNLQQTVFFGALCSDFTFWDQKWNLPSKTLKHFHFKKLYWLWIKFHIKIKHIMIILDIFFCIPMCFSVFNPHIFLHISLFFSDSGFQSYRSVTVLVWREWVSGLGHPGNVMWWQHMQMQKPVALSNFPTFFFFFFHLYYWST